MSASSSQRLSLCSQLMRSVCTGRRNGELAIEGRVRVAEPDERDEPLDDRPRQRLLYLCRRVVVAVDRAALPRRRDRVDIVRAGEQAHVVDLRDATGEELDRPGREVPCAHPPQRPRSRCALSWCTSTPSAACELARIRLTLPPRLTTVSASARISSGARMPSRSGRTGIPSWLSSVVTCRCGDAARWAARRSTSPECDSVKDEPRQHEVVGPEAPSDQVLARRGDVVDLGQDAHAHASRPPPTPIRGTHRSRVRP